ncbi:MAG: DUF1501 domain-containing protein [Planctomycetes bacterium]|nr:DUF1501 domain-containing protein [Planctomycetota bacterium]
MDGREAWEAVTRRGALRRLALAAAGLPLVELLGRWTPGAAPAPALAEEGTPTPGTGGARTVIEIWMSGGPCHLDTFDPKPEAGRDFCGPLDRAVPTAVDGMRLGALFPLLAAQASRFSLLRGLSHGNNGHETAAFISRTGRAPGERTVHPGIGSVVSLMRGYGAGYDSLIPPFVVLTTPLGRVSEQGFLGPRYAPFVTGGDPARPRFTVEGVVSEEVTEERQRSRRDLLSSLDLLGRALPGHPALERFDAAGRKAWDMILGDAGKVFDLAAEPDPVRDLYGRNTFGQSCLAARRLAERGVPYVLLHSPGWDTHKQHFEAMRRRLPEVDRGLAALLQDLDGRGLLGATIVWCGGEFGRTPRVDWAPPWNGGRHHFGNCFSWLVAGGGIRGGRVIGASDARGEEPAGPPLHPRDVHRLLFRLLGIDPDGPLPNPMGLDLRVTEGGPPAGKGPLDGLL